MKIKLYNDLVFKWIFGRQEHTSPLIALLNAVTGIPDKFSDIRILNPFDNSEPFKNEKQGILDIRGKDSLSDDWFDLEVQVINRFYYPQRSKYYLAGLYREQLEKSSENNYTDLKPCYGIHILVQTLFDSDDDAKCWFNHYAMLNTRTYKSLVDHWHLYYIELEKFLSCCRNRQQEPETELEQWAYFLGKIQDNTQQLDEKISSNSAIKEVYEMLQTFTKDDRLREQYRLREEFLRDERTVKTRIKQLEQDHIAAVKAEKAAVKAKEKERKEKEKERKEKEKILQQSIKFMNEKGSTKDEIAQMLNISVEWVETVLKLRN